MSVHGVEAEREPEIFGETALETRIRAEKTRVSLLVLSHRQAIFKIARGLKKMKSENQAEEIGF